jgi:Asp-tRNA(Asn)/Glu-tRNA(Gln) amidotransferase A subunit family amidase
MLVAAVLAGVAATVAALLGGLLFTSDNPRLPSLAQLQRDEPPKGYDLADLAAPRVTGISLRVLAWLTRSRVIGRIVCHRLYDQNKMIQVRRVAASVSDQPLYYPLVDPSLHAESTGETMAPLDLVAFSQQRSTGQHKQLQRGSFRHWSIHDYTSRYKSGELSPVQVARAVLAGIDASKSGPTPLRIFVERHDDNVLTHARASAERYARGAPLGVLDGVPIAVKDEMDVKGFYHSAGTSFLGQLRGVSSEDTLPIARLRAQGAIIIGTTNMHEVGSGVTGFNRTFGTPRNPYNPAHYPGGSSSGSSVAVSSGLVPLAIGLDAGGSVRIPAGFCGVVGLKPTFLRVPPICADCPSLGHVGPIAGSVRDAALAYAVMSGGHESVARSLLQPPVRLHRFDATASLDGLTIGYFPSHVNHSAPEIASATLAALQHLESLGAQLVQVELDFLQAIHFAHSITVSTEIAQHLDEVFSDFHRLSPESQILLSFARQFTAIDFVAAQRLRAFALRQLEENVFSKCDVLLSPTTAITAPRIPADALAYGELDTVALGRIMRFTVYANFVGNPAIAVPMGLDTLGLPMSLQLQSRHYGEDVMLRVAHAMEQLCRAEQTQPQVYFSIIESAASQSKD